MGSPSPLQAAQVRAALFDDDPENLERAKGFEPSTPTLAKIQVSIPFISKTTILYAKLLFLLNVTENNSTILSVAYTSS